MSDVNKIHFDLIVKFCGLHDHFDKQKDGSWKEMRSTLFSFGKTKMAITEEKMNHPFGKFNREQLKEVQLLITADASLIQHTMDEYLEESKLTEPENEEDDE